LIQLDYLMENFDRYLEEDFTPSNDDILRARQRTTGGETYAFEEERHRWELTDVGGQYNERVKWAGYFSESPPHAIIFFLALDEYNIPNTELKTESCATKFDLALSVFKENLCSKGPVLDHKICRLVFLNKVDLFEEKIKDDAKWDSFKKVMGYNGARDVNDAIGFLKEMLLGMDNEAKRDEDVDEIRIHVTNALNTELMAKIAGDIKTSILTSTMKFLGIL